MTVPQHVRATAASACGPTRTHNEDMAILGDVTVRDGNAQAEWFTADLRRPFLAAVLDGLGGHNGGAEASARVAARLAVSASRWAPDCSADALRAALIECVADAHRELNDTGQRDASRAGMGTTCTALLFAPVGVLLTHIGDSRCYRRRDGLWKLLTEDHAVSVASGPGNSVSRLTFAIGAALGELPSEPVSEITAVTFAGDAYLLVTDGVIAAAGDETLLETAFDASDAAALLDQVLQHGGPDNATAVLLEIVS